MMVVVKVRARIQMLIMIVIEKGLITALIPIRLLILKVRLTA
ncbi:hypothetical protein HRbin04_01247 [archaeon HR04]|nr:hypothetical protein HRbin04_01247 [archaeon HR04]